MSKLLHGLPAQIFLVGLLPLIVIVAAVSFGSIAMHQSNMRELVSERDMRTAMATASMLQNLLKQTPEGQLSLTPQKFAMLINPMPDQQHVSAFVVDAEGRVLYHTEPEWIGREMHDHGGVAEALRAEHGVVYRVDHMGGDEHMIAYAPIISGTQRLALIIEEPWQMVIDPTMQYSMIGPLVMLPVLLICAAAIFLVVTRIVRPLQQLRGQAQRASAGELAALSQPVGGVEEIEHLQTSLTSMAKQIEQDEARLRNYAQSVTVAQEQERQRLARELHDDTIQNLIVLSQRLQLAKLAANGDSATVKGRLDEMRTHVLQMIEDVRRFSRALHPIYLEAAGLVSALERLAGESDKLAQQQTPAGKVTFASDGPIPRLSPAEELTCFRIAQEGINNALKHAHATEISVQLHRMRDDRLELTIDDNGIGFAQDRPQQGWGLTGIRERATSIGAQVEIASGEGKGTHIRIWMPCPQC